MRKRILILTIVSALFPFLAWCATAKSRAGISAPEKLDTLRGEVVDIQCYLRDRGNGEDSAAPSAGAGLGNAVVTGNSSATVEKGSKAKPGEEGGAVGWNACGSEAVRRGAPVGILPEPGKDIYLAVMDDRRPAGHELASEIGRSVTLAGHLRNESGVRLFEIVKILPAPAEAERHAGRVE